PGPACYGRGGDQPTVTDANLVLGRLATDAPLAGGVALDVEAAQRAIGVLAQELGLQTRACAEGIIRVADAEMVRALRVVTVQRGIDPRRYALLAFGGAGPLHAAHIAQELGIEKIVCPRASGVLAALGLVVSARRRDVQRSVFLAGDTLTRSAIAALTEELGARARDQLGDSQAQLTAVYELRYRGQAFELAVSGALDADPDQLRADFEAQHEERYGYRDGEQELELVTLRVSAAGPGADVALGAAEDDLQRLRRRATLDGEESELDVLRGSLGPGTKIRGPAVVELPESTLLVAAGWSGQVDDQGTISLTKGPAEGSAED
ncbi:MAG: hydantoinase/oxoprolinase family protein, partial [Actinomycetota bacterium]|nr:hydantoinase/oxoprolinase family protein [Actinomycetota bacterium]